MMNLCGRAGLNELLLTRNQIFVDQIRLNSLRGVAVLLVLLAHMDAYEVVKIWPIFLFKGFIGEIGVNIFFILSGILIWKTASQTLSSHGLKKYVVNRVTRIYPVYLASLIIIILCQPMFIGDLKPSLNLTVFLRHLFFLQEFSPAVSRLINPVTWSLTYEFVFYVLVPILFFSRIVNSTFIFFSIIIAWIVWINFPLQNLIFFKYWPLFALGIYLNLTEFVLKRRFCLLILLLGLVLTIADSTNYLSKFLVASSIVLFFSTAEFNENSFNRALAKLGAISYSVYLWHYPLLEIYGNYTSAILDYPMLRAILFIALLAAISLISYLIIEKPFMTNIRGWLIRRYCL